MASAPLANLGVNAVNPGGDIQGVVAAGQMFGNLARTRMQIAAQQSAQAFGAGTQFLRAEQDAILSEERAKNSLAQKFGFEDFGKLNSAAETVGQPLNEYMANLESRRMSILNRQQVADEVYRINTVRPVEMNYDYVRGESMLAAAQLRKMADEKLQYAAPEQKAQYQALNSQYAEIMSDPANQTANAGEIRRLFQGVQQQQAQILATIPDPPKSATERWRMAKTPEERQAIAQELVSPIADPKTGETIGFGILDDDPRGGLGLKSLLPVNKLERADRMHPIAEALLSGEPEKVKAATALIQSGQVPIGNTGAVLTPVIKGNKIEFEVVKPTGGGGDGASSTGGAPAGMRVSPFDVDEFIKGMIGGDWKTYEGTIQSEIEGENRNRRRMGQPPMTIEEENAYKQSKRAEPLKAAIAAMGAAQPQPALPATAPEAAAAQQKRRAEVATALSENEKAFNALNAKRSASGKLTPQEAVQFGQLANEIKRLRRMLSNGGGTP